MTPSFSSCLVNEPFGDPGLYVEVRWSKRALLFDLGDNATLSPTCLLKASDVFISHTHMDHFIGFDRLLRITLGRGKRLRLFGPPGLIANVAGKLHGYTWNLVDGYPLSIEVKEFRPDGPRTAIFHATTGFALTTDSSLAEAARPYAPFSMPFEVHVDPMFTVRGVALNHRVFCFAYALQEQFHININKERLHAAGLPVGSWLKALKQHVWDGRPDDFRFRATLFYEHRREDREFRLGELRERFITITQGQKLVYVVDVRFDQDNEAKIVELAQGADVLYCEAPYLERDAGKARERYHLTARQAGLLARQAGVRHLVVFHFSPRYTGIGHELACEAMAAFEGR